MTFFLLLTGCTSFVDMFAPFADADIADAIVLGVEAPADLDLSASEYGDGSAATVFLACLDGSDPSGSNLTISAPSMGTVPLTEDESDVWATTSGEGLKYISGEPYAILRDGNEILRADAAPAAKIDQPKTHAAGEPMEIQPAQQDFDALIVVVVDVRSGTTLWSNLPTDALGVSDLLADESPLDVAVPGGIFEEDAQLAVGVAGLRVNAPSETTDVNAVASMMMTGVLDFWAVSTSW